jgi:phosphatidylserine/phosphatidylglycerophosphate/cardiolipin synthase-like enzyme
MRVTASKAGVRVKAYAGTTGVLVACDVDEDARQRLLGFAIERKVGRARAEWLLGKLGFEGEHVDEGRYFPSNERPFQKFRWSDYRVEPGASYAYTVHPVYGTPDAPDVHDGPTVKVKTTTRTPSGHTVLFNRAAAASQAFSKKFPRVDEAMTAARTADREYTPPADVRAWLARGLLDQILSTIDRATGSDWALDIAAYEYEEPDVVRAVRAAHRRGVKVRVVYHARADDDQTDENEHHLRSLPARVKRARVTSRIFHDKFIVLSKIVASGGRRPRSVLCGSTNFTHNGVYRQANVVHVVEDRSVAEHYLDIFEVLFAGATPRETKAWINANNPIDFATPVYVGFSPRSGYVDLEAIAETIADGERDVLFSTAFALDQRVLDALLGDAGDDVIRLGVQNTRSSITGFHRDRSANFSATALLNTGLEGFLKESLAGQKGRILIHTKLVVVDFTSDSPTVISGSHNFSGAASTGNDENFLVVGDDTDVADCYGVELMRIYDHYRFRWAIKQGWRAPHLTRDASWTDRYFDPDSLASRDRRRFVGA